MVKKNSLRAIVLNIAKRNKDYHVSQYTWECTKKLGYKVTNEDVRRCLSNLKFSNKLQVIIAGAMVIAMYVCNHHVTLKPALKLLNK